MIEFKRWKLTYLVDGKVETTIVIAFTKAGAINLVPKGGRVRSCEEC